MASFRVRFAVLFSLLTLAPVPVVAQVDGASAPLELRAGDAVRLEVRDEPGLAGDFQIDESGRVLLPLIGIVPVAGREFSAVRGDVERAYARELSQSEVRITPLLRIAVLGEVRQPGLYPIDPTYTLADVLAGAGGLGPDADRDRIELVRGGQVVSSVSQQTAGSLAQTLRSGDQIVVGRRGWLSINSPALLGAGLSLLVAVTTTLLLR